MTPLEELQAAHKRLSELCGQPMVEGDTGYGAGSVAPSDLVVTLHRTIDAQLAVLGRGIEGCQLVRRNSIAADAGATWTAIALPLARAINGEAS